MTQWHQIYLIPTIRITHDKFLYGFYNIGSLVHTFN